MQLKFKRYTGSRGLISKETTYCLEAVLLATPEESQRISAFERWGSAIWIYGNYDLDTDDEEYKRQVMKTTFGALTGGVLFEFKNFNNVARIESLIATAAKGLLGTVEMLASFDGSERVIEVDEDTATVVATG